MDYYDNRLLDLLFGVGPALRYMFLPGMRPRKEDLLEITEEQYEEFYRQNGHNNGATNSTI